MKRENVGASPLAGKVRKVVGGKHINVKRLGRPRHGASQAREFVVKLDRTSGISLGADVDLSDGKTILIEHIKDEGAIHEWNAANPSDEIRPRCRLVEINGVREDADALIEECKKCTELSITVRKPAVKKLCRTRAGIAARLEQVNWMPLESNPEMFTAFSTEVGLSEEWSFVDVLGVDSEFLSMVPQPCLGVILLFQYTQTFMDSVISSQATASSNERAVSPDVFFMKQFVGNACGTIAALHVLGNSAETVQLGSDAALARFMAGVQGATPKDIGAALADFEEFHMASDESAVDGQTEALDAEEDTDHHFICFIEKGGDVYELDGAKASPINHGPCGGGLLKAAATIIQEQFMKRDPENLHFNMMALVRSES